MDPAQVGSKAARVARLEPDAHTRKALAHPQRYIPPERAVRVEYGTSPSAVDLKRRPDGSFGPFGLYGARVPRSALLDLLRNSVKPNRIYRIEEVLTSRTTRVTMLLENLVDGANASACTRTCEALGLQRMHVIESYEPFRTSMGITRNADKWIDISRYADYSAALSRLRDQGYTLIATCLDEDAVAIEEVDFGVYEKVCVMLGNEQRGLSTNIRNEADVKVKIPMVGMSQSLNISTTCGIFAHHLRCKGMTKPNLTDAEIQTLYMKWMVISSKSSSALLEKHGMAHLVPDYV